MWIVETFENITSKSITNILDVDAKTLVTPRSCLLVSVGLLAGYLWINSRRQRYSVVPRWPPGPKPWPIIGNLLDMKETGDKRVMDNVQDMVDEYGEMVHLYLGMGIDLVIISGVDLLHEAYVEKADIFSNRPLHLKLMEDRKDKGLFLRNGEEWKRVKRFMMRTMKDLGLSKPSLQLTIQEEANQIVEEFLKHGADQAFSPQSTFYLSVANVISSLIFNERYSHDDKKFLNMLKSINIIIKNGSTEELLRSFLPLCVMKLFSNGIQELDKAFADTYSFIEEISNQHRLDFDQSELRDFTDYYIKAEKEKDENNITEKDMFHLIVDLFIAGTETTSALLNWTILHMIRHPSIQQKCRDEIHMVIGTSRSPSWNDRGTLPYTEAMILEVQRISNIVPIGFAHCTSEAVELRGYLIPEKTLILSNVSGSMMSDKYWSEPQQFRPERWLTDDLTALKADIPDAFIPFGIGPRACPGDHLAKMELFIFSVTLLQRLTFTHEHEHTLPSTRGIQRAIVTTAPFNVNVSSCL